MRMMSVVFCFSLLCGCEKALDVETSPSTKVASEVERAEDNAISRAEVNLVDEGQPGFRPASLQSPAGESEPRQGIPRDVHLHEKVAPDLTSYDLWKYELCL